MRDDCFIDSLSRCIGQTVTIFTSSGGASGSGYTGVLAGITDSSVKLITAIGSPPSCPISNDYPGWGIAGLFGSLLKIGNCYSNSWRHPRFGAITEISIAKIVSFTHSTL